MDPDPQVLKFAAEPGGGEPAQAVVNVTHVDPFAEPDESVVRVQFWMLALLVALAALGLGELVALIALA